ncbi:acyltransferase [Paenibacillus sp. y28]|uniref:acyltransferase n=1 Tax=Paenibacillus sp. y28 TaxID=3129110 RepID=UPI003019834F
MKSKPKLIELDIVRAFAILAVLFIHGTSEGIVDMPQGTPAQLIYLSVNKVSNFAVPVFLLLSGMVLFYAYQGGWSWRRAAGFYRKRLQYIVVPYLIWSMLYYLFHQRLAGSELRIDWREYADLLPWADANYHLYYVIIILQMYVLFPIVMTVMERWPRLRPHLIWLGFAVQALFFSYGHWVEPIPNSPSLATSYLGVFLLGGYIGLNYEAFVRHLPRLLLWAVPASLCMGAALAGFFILDQSGIGLGQILYELLFNAYPVAASVVMIGLARRLLSRRPALSRILLSLGAVSFGIYLLHPMVLTIWRVNMTADRFGMEQYHLLAAGALVTSLVIPWLLVLVYQLVTKRLRTAWRRRLQPESAGQAASHGS